MTPEPDNTPPVPRVYPTTGQPRRSRTSFKDLTGHRFGRWEVLAEHPKTRPGQSKWQCRCDCGTIKPAVLYSSLVEGQSQSCGCLKREQSSKPLHQQHGHKNPTYRSWHAMKAREGVCPEWVSSFDQFLQDMGPRPEGTRLVSLDGRRWSKGTCEWRAKTPPTQCSCSFPHPAHDWCKGIPFPTKP